LFPYIAEGIRQCQPRIVFLENVEGIISAKTADGESVLKYVLGELEGLGYRATAGIFSASEVGAPHQRKRVFILGYSEHDGSPGGRDLEVIQGEPYQSATTVQQPAGSSSATDMAHGISEGSQGRLRRGQDSGRKSLDGHLGCSGSSTRDRWPSKPGNPQHDWEAPRVVGDTESQQGSPDNHGRESGATGESGQVELGGGRSRTLREGDRQAQSRLGGTANGSSDRVDRLRLCGNGVVPATAEKAFTTLLLRVL